MGVPRAADIETLGLAATEGDLPWQWRGLPPGIESFRQTFWDGAVAHWAVRPLTGHELIGHVLFYGAGVSGRHCFMQAWVRPELRRTGWPIEGVALAISQMFLRFDLRKIMIEAPEPALAQYTALASIPGIDTEGVLRAHVFVDGDYQDVHLLAIHRQRWSEAVGAVLPHLAGSS